MADVAVYIEAYGIKKFLQMSSKAQNQHLYDHYQAKTSGEKANIRTQKMNFLQKVIAPSVNLQQSLSLPTAPSPTPSVAPAVGPNAATLFKSSFLNEVLSIQSTFVHAGLNCNVKDAVELRGLAQQFEGGHDIPGWDLPPQIADNTNKALVEGRNKQCQIIEAICDPSIEIVAVEAAKRHGKSTAAFVGICQGVWEGHFSKIGLWASGEDNALGILNDVFTDSISVVNTFPLFKGTGSRQQKIFYNNAVIKAFSNNAAHTSGLDFDLCWIDEAHEVVVEHPEVFDMIVMTMRAKPNIKLLITMNKGTGTYHIFRDTLEKKFGREVAFFTIEDADITHITEEADAKVRTLVAAVGGKDEVTRWLDNQTVAYGTFDPMSVMRAYQGYDDFLSIQRPTPAFTVMAFDPSGSGHPMGWGVWSCDASGERFWKRDGGLLRLGDNLDEIRFGERLTPEQIKLFLLDKARKYQISLFISESNMNGKDMKMEFLLAGFQAKNQNYTTDRAQKDGASRGAMIHIVRTIMDDEALYFEGEGLKNEYLIYNPDEHEKEDKYKGNEADASIHAVYRLVRLSRSPYLKRGKGQNYSEVNQHV